jgi:acyl-CoA thioesterase I
METRISIFGDSITWGASDYKFGGWVTRLQNYFETDENNEIDVYNLGISGDTTNDLLIRFKTECLARNRHSQIIMFAIGTNDSQYINSKNNPRTSIEKFENNLEKLINQAKEFSDKIIFVGLAKVDESKLMPVPWSAEKFYDNDNISKYNSVIENISKKNTLPFINLFDLLDMGDLEDGLHPNSKGHEKMFLKIKEFLLSNKIVQ